MYSRDYFDVNKPAASQEPNEKMSYRKKEKFSSRASATEKWKEACFQLHPDFDSLPEAAKEMIESKLKVEYYIALGSNTSLPRTATSGSIQTPRVSPLVKRPSRVPSRAPSAPATPARFIPTRGPLPPLPLLPNLSLPPPLSPLPTSRSPLAPSLSPLPPHFSPLPPLSLAPITPLPPFLSTNLYSSPYYQTDESLVSSSTIKPAEDPFIRKADPRSYNGPSTSFSVPKLARSSSSYVDCPSIYGVDEIYASSSVNETNNNEDEPYDYSYETLSRWDP